MSLEYFTDSFRKLDVNYFIECHIKMCEMTIIFSPSFFFITSIQEGLREILVQRVTKSDRSRKICSLFGLTDIAFSREYIRRAIRSKREFIRRKSTSQKKEMELSSAKKIHVESMLLSSACELFRHGLFFFYCFLSIFQLSFFFFTSPLRISFRK